MSDVEKITRASDHSTKNLFGAIEKRALSPKTTVSEFIAARRIFIYNIWPWFRCGQQSSGKDGIHSDFSKVPCLEHWLAMLINCFNPRKIATLGTWAFNDDAHTLEADIRYKRPSWFIKNFLKSTPAFAGHKADSPEVRQFYHPSRNNFWKGEPSWFAATPEYLPPVLPSRPCNKCAFEFFLDYLPVTPPDVLNGCVDE